MSEHMPEMTGLERIAAERQRQIDQEGWTSEHDDQHSDGSLGLAAACYAAPISILVPTAPYTLEEIGAVWHGAPLRSSAKDAWPWERTQDKRRQHSRLRQLEIAGALIIAEIDRIQRVAQSMRDDGK